jgi:hypothetical protein
MHRKSSPHGNSDAENEVQETEKSSTDRECLCEVDLESPAREDANSAFSSLRTHPFGHSFDACLPQSSVELQRCCRATMLHHPTDVQLLFLDHVKSPADLQALCLTSTSFRSIATPRLYQKIRLQADQIVRFLRGVAAGTRRELWHARELTFEILPSPPEPTTVQTSNINLSFTHAAAASETYNEQINMAL